jgi:hypothetical protein
MVKFLLPFLRSAVVAQRNLDSIDHVCTLAKPPETTRLLAGFLLATEIVQI